MTAATQGYGIAERFNLWDADGNGVISRSDFEAEANRILEAFGETPGSAAGSELFNAYLGLWSALAESTGVGADGSVTAAQFAAVAQSQLVNSGYGGEAGFDEFLRPTIRAIVHLLDTDGDGEVDRAEFGKWIAAIGLGPDQADAAFAQIDTNNDGRLSVDELIIAVRDYHLGKSNLHLLG